MIRLLTIFGVAMVGLATSSQVSAQVACGDEITGDAVLEGDLQCAEKPALTVTGPGSLDLGGFTVTCLDNGTGIQVVGNARLTNGKVTACNDGLALSGRGPVGPDVTALDNTGEGFSVSAASALLARNVSRRNGRDGFHMTSDGGILVDNTARQNLRNGIWFNGISGRIVGNISTDNVKKGIVVIKLSVDISLAGLVGMKL